MARNVAVGSDRNAALGHRFEIGLGREIGMDDPIDARLGGGARRARTARMDGDAQIAAMRLGGDRGDLLLRQHLRFAGTAVGHLDEIDAVLALAAHLVDHLIRAVAQHAHGMIGRADPGRLVILDAAIGDDHAAGAMNARPLHHAEPIASRTATSMKQVPPGTAMLVTPARSTRCALRAALMVLSSGRDVAAPARLRRAAWDSHRRDGHARR